MAKPAEKSFKELEPLLLEYEEKIDELYSLYNMSPTSDKVQKKGIRATASDLNEEDPFFDFSSLYYLIESGVQIIKRTIQLLETNSDPVQPCLAMEMPKVLSDEDRKSLWPEVIQHDRKMMGIIKDLKMYTMQQCNKSPASQELGEMVNNTRSIFQKIISYTKVCKTCAELEDSYWELTIPSEDTTCGNVKYSVRSTAGMYECSETGLRWRCISDVSLEYCYVDWKSQQALKEMDYKPCGPLMDITVSSGTLQEIHLPHFICVDSECSSHAEVKAFHVKDGDVLLETCELTRFHAKLLSPTFSLWGIIAEAQQYLTMKFHCKTLIYRSRSPRLNLHVYLIVSNPKLEQDVKEKEMDSGSVNIHKPYPDEALPVRKYYTLKASCDSRIRPRRMMLNPCIANFFDVNITCAEEDFELYIMAKKGKLIWDVDIHLDAYPEQTVDAGKRSVHVILLDCLMDLKAEDMKVFTWHLSNGVENFRKVPKCSLENLKRCEVVTCLINQYKRDGAAKVTAIILRIMGMNNDADSLEEALRS